MKYVPVICCIVLTLVSAIAGSFAFDMGLRALMFACFGISITSAIGTYLIAEFVLHD